MKIWIAAFLSFWLFLGGIAPGKAADSLSIDSLSWMSGDWRGTDPDGVLEEHYSPLAGHSILGTSRIVSNGDSVHLEWILLEQTADGVFQTVSLPRLKKTFTFKLIRRDGETWVFETTDLPKVQRLTFSHDGADGMRIKLEKEQDGKPWSVTFQMRRVPPKQ